MQIFLIGFEVALVGLIVALIVGNIVILVLLHDIPWLRLFRQLHDVEVFKNLTYIGSSKNHKHQLDLYRPKGDKGFPMVMFVHGGYWTSGDKDYYQAFTGLYANIGVALARNGVGAAVINYRLAPSVSFDEQLADVAAALRWVQENAKAYDGEPKGIFLMGHSAGGHIVALLSAERRYLEEAGVRVDGIGGCIPVSAIFDLEDMAKKNDAVFNDTVTRTVFGTMDGAVLRARSPIDKFRLGMPHLLLLGGERDYPYLITQGERARERLGELNVQADAYTIPGYTHMDMVLKFGRDDDEVLRRILEFIDSTHRGMRHRSHR